MPEELKRKLYWSKASKFQLDGYKKEQRNQQGMVVAGSESIDFNEHIYATDNKAKIKYIEGSRAFRNKKITLCEDDKMATALTRAHNAVRAGVVQVESMMKKDVFSQPK